MELLRVWHQGMGGASEAVVMRSEYLVEKSEERLDLFLARQDTGLTRSQTRRLMEEGHVLLNGGVTKAGRRLRPGDRVSLVLPPLVPLDLAPEAIPLNIIYQDMELLVVDKPAGLTVHPAPGHPSHTLVHALLALCPDLQGIGGALRPGIVHRLDKDTSGLMVVAKSSRAHLSLTEQIKDRTIRKGYLALAMGRVEPPKGVIEAPIGRDPRNRKRMAVVQGGRESSTSYRVLRYFRENSYVEVFPRTGRTHQIRVHFSSTGHPLVGDAIYAKKSPLLERQFLHAHLLGFQHPVTGKYLEFSSPLPEELHRVIEALSLSSLSVPLPGG